MRLSHVVGLRAALNKKEQFLHKLPRLSCHLPQLPIARLISIDDPDPRSASTNVCYWGDSRTILPVSSTMQMLVSLTETSSPAKWSMLRFSF